MSDKLGTLSLLDHLARFQAGEKAALDQLLRLISDRLEGLARAMLRGFPLVRACAETGDVLQNALIRLTRSLREVRPPSTADFFRLAAEQIRRELLDLARYHRRRTGVGEALLADAPDPNAPIDHELDRWQALHEAVEQLPADQREVFSLTFYHDWTQAEIAQLLGVSDRQVRRLWRAACLRLNELLGGDLPGT